MYLPPLVETAEELAPKINKTPQWIISRAGVKERRVSQIDVDKMGALDKVYVRINKDIDQNKISKSDIKLLIPHQASGKGVRAYSKFGGFQKEQVMDIVESTGNCVAASLPLAMVMAQKKALFSEGDLIYLVGTGAGLSIASALIKI